MPRDYVTNVAFTHKRKSAYGDEPITLYQQTRPAYQVVRISNAFQDPGNYPYDPYRVFVQSMILGALKDVLEIGTYIAKGERARERNLSLAWLKSEECSQFLAFIGLTHEDIERILSEPPERVKKLLAPGKNHRTAASYDVQRNRLSGKAAELRRSEAP